jgi:hypothetical protein
MSFAVLLSKFLLGLLVSGRPRALSLGALHYCAAEVYVAPADDSPRLEVCVRIRKHMAGKAKTQMEAKRIRESKGGKARTKHRSQVLHTMRQLPHTL